MDVEVFIENQSSEATKRAYRYDLAKWAGWLGDTTPDQVSALAFRKWLEENHHPRTAARVFNTCRSFYAFRGGDNPFAGLKSPRRVSNSTPKVPDDHLVDEMVAICDNPRDKAVISLLLNGLRASEVADLTPESSLTLSDGTVVLRVVGKGLKERLVPLGDEARVALRVYGSGGPKFLFPNGNGGRLSLRQVEYIVEKWSRAAGMEIRPHKLRHHYATRLVRSNVNVFALQRLLGHASVATTQVYVSLDLHDVIQESRKDPRNEGAVKKGLRVVA